MSAASRYSVMDRMGSGRVMGRSIGKYAVVLGVSAGAVALVAGLAPALLSSARLAWISDGSESDSADR
jgi:hypothetical protein